MYKVFNIILLISLISGCSGNPTAVRTGEMVNKQLLEEFAPMRVDVKVFDNGTALMSQIWAGEVGSSIVTPTNKGLNDDVLSTIQQKCDFQLSERKEVRIVKHEAPFYYEVWVFNDIFSERDDGTTGLSIVLTSLTSGRTDIKIFGSCPA